MGVAQSNGACNCNNGGLDPATHCSSCLQPNYYNYPTCTCSSCTLPHTGLSRDCAADCDSATCSNHGTCLPTDGSCNCTVGYQAPSCGSCVTPFYWGYP